VQVAAFAWSLKGVDDTRDNRALVGS
jgi:hypothetical protein